LLAHFKDRMAKCLLSFFRCSEDKNSTQLDSIVGSEKVASDLLECPICLEIPKSKPIYQCDNGHLICKTCRQKVTVCPQCRKPLGENRSLIAEKLLEKCAVPCPFAKHGCELRLLAVRIAEHVQVCVFREVLCPVFSCTGNVPIW